MTEAAERGGPGQARVAPHGGETLPWVPRSGRRTELREYVASIPPLIADSSLHLSPDVARASREVAAEIAVLERGHADQISALEPFLLRTEAIASSQIEEERTTVDQLARAEYGIRAPKTARTVKGAIDALRFLVSSASDGVTLDGLVAAHHPLVANDVHERWEAGRLRTVQNWIGGSDRSPLGALHVPPAPGRVPGLMADLMDFMRRTDVDPLLQAAAGHAQFESIHPFTDGNGRIGRSLINALWRYRRLTARVAVPIAAAIAADREGYFALLDGYRAGDVEAFALYLADAAQRSACEAGVSARRLAALPAQWRELVRPRAGSAASALLPQLTKTPIVDAADVMRLTGASQAAAYAAIGRLADVGVLRPITESKREMVWAAGDVLDEADLMVDRLRLGSGG